MNKKKILVIGAGSAQEGGIQKAKDLGYHVLASDGSATAPGLKIAHESKVIDVKDVQGNLAWALEAQVDGVVSFASDITLKTVQAIREKLRKPGLGIAPMTISMDKALQRQCFKAAGLAQPDFETATDWPQLQAAAQRLGFPLVVKPVDNAGSRGVTILENEDLLQEAYKDAKGASHSGLLVAEKFMEGRDLSIDGISIKGSHHILAIAEKFKPRGKYPVTRQLVYSADITVEDEARIINLLKNAYDAAKVDNTPTHTEIMLTDEGPKIIEMACRGGGFFIFTHIVQAVCGYDIVANWVRMCTGEPVEPLPQEFLKRGAVLKFFSPPAGRLAGVTGLREAQGIAGVQTGLFVQTGEMVHELRSGGNRTGWMIAFGEDRQEALFKAEKASSLVNFQVEALR